MDTFVFFVIDINPVVWGSFRQNTQESLSLSPSISFDVFLHHVLNFMASYACLGEGSFCVLVSTPRRSSFVSSSVKKSVDLFDIKKIGEEIVAMMQYEVAHADEFLGLNSNLAGGLSSALCYLNRKSSANLSSLSSDSFGNQISFSSSKHASRIFVIWASPDSTAQHMHVMNAAFSAKSSLIPIDCCMVGQNDSELLLHCANVSSGRYYKLSPATSKNNEVFYEQLIFNFLAPPPVSYDTSSSAPFPPSSSHSIADKLIYPEKKAVNLKPTCICHHRFVDLAYVCSKCFAVFCSHLQFCLNCKSPFSVPVSSSSSSLSSSSSPSATLRTTHLYSFVSEILMEHDNDSGDGLNASSHSDAGYGNGFDEENLINGEK